MKLLAVAMVMGLCLLAVIPGTPNLIPLDRKGSCCMTDGMTNQGRISCNMNSQVMHPCNCKTQSTTPAGPSSAGSCGGTCGSLIAPAAQPSTVLDRLRRYAVGGYRRITSNNLLKHESRRLIYEIIIATPGVDLRMVAEMTGMNENTLCYHLERMVEGGKIKTTTIGGVTHFFENHGKYTSEEQILIARMQTAGSCRILQIIMKHPGLTRGELAGILGVTGPTVTRSVQNLVGEGLIRVERDGRFTRYYPEKMITGEKYPAEAHLHPGYEETAFTRYGFAG